VSRPTLQLTEPSFIQWVTRNIFLGGKEPELEIYYSMARLRMRGALPLLPMSSWCAQG